MEASQRPCVLSRRPRQPWTLALFRRHQDIHLEHLVQRQVAIGTGVNGPKGDPAIGRRLPNEHVVEGEVVADGVLERERRLLASLALDQQQETRGDSGLPPTVPLSRSPGTLPTGDSAWDCHQPRPQSCVFHGDKDW